MLRNALALLALTLALGVSAAGAGAAALKPLQRLNGIPCRQVVSSGTLSGYSCGRSSDARSYVVTIEIADHSPYGRPADVRSGTWVRSTRIGAAGRVYVMVVATRSDGNVRLARHDAAATARQLARARAA